MTVRAQNPKGFYSNRYAAAAGVLTTVRDVSGTLAPAEMLVIGGPTLDQSTGAVPLEVGTLYPLVGTSFCNLVVTNLAAADADTNLAIADGVDIVSDEVGAGIGLIVPRAPRYTAAHEDQKVLFNPNEVSIDYTITYEATALPGFVSGGHPGNGVTTINLGTVDPTEYDVATAPLRFRIQAGRKWVITAAHVRSVTPIAPTGTATVTLERSDATSVSAVALNLKTLTTGSPTMVTLEADILDRTIEATQHLDIVVNLGSYDGTAGDIMIDIAYTLP